VAVAFSAENLLSVAKTIRKMFKNEVIICADNDSYREINIGLEKASDAAQEIKCKVVYPVFKDVSTSPTDFNDLYTLEGSDAVRKIFLNAGVITNEYIFEFLNRTFQRAEPIMAPWLDSGTINMLFAKPGVGKSLLALHIAYAIISGKGMKALEWEVKQPNVVLYLEGELRGESIQKDFICIAQGEVSYSVGRNLSISTLDDVKDDNVDIGNVIWQDRIDGIISMRKPKLIIIDNILTFVRSGKTNEVEFWNRITNWTRTHTRTGTSFLFIHHESKHGNASYGTSAIENSMSTIISLSKVAEEEDEEDEQINAEKNPNNISTSFVLEYKKTRYTDKLPALTVTIKTSFDKKSTTLTAEPFKKSLKLLIIEIFNAQAISYKEIQYALLSSGIKKPPGIPYISRVLHKAYKDGLITRALCPWEKFKTT
jgi:hypothetical protein